MVFGAGAISGITLITIAFAVSITRVATRLALLRAGAWVAWGGVLSLDFGLFLTNRLEQVKRAFPTIAR